MSRLKRLVVAAVLGVTLSGCASIPTSLTPTGAIVFRANEAADRVETLQTVVIALNGAHVPGASDANTRVVINAIAEGFPVLAKAPEGVVTTVSAILDVVATRLDAAGKATLESYVRLIQAFLNARDAGDMRAVFPGPLPTDAEMRVVFALTIAQTLEDGRRWTASHP